MARLPQLVEALFRRDGRDVATLGNLARVVREAGYIATTKRGAGASEMRLSDAANLLIGTNGSEAPKDAALAVEHFRALVPRYFIHQPEDHPVFGALDRSETFGEALETLIELAPALCLLFFERIRAAYPPDTVKRPGFIVGSLETGFCGANVEFIRGVAPMSTRITIWLEPAPDLEPIKREWRFTVDPERMDRNEAGPVHDKSRLVTVAVDFLTVFHLAVALHKPGEVMPGFEGLADD